MDLKNNLGYCSVWLPLGLHDVSNVFAKRSHKPALSVTFSMQPSLLFKSTISCSFLTIEIDLEQKNRTTTDCVMS